MASAGALTITPVVSEATMPASPPHSPLMLIDLVMVTAPKPPGSSTLISPAVAVLEMAPAKVLHGAVRLHGLASSPTPETHVRVAWAAAGPATSMAQTAVESRASLRMGASLSAGLGGPQPWR